MNQYTVEHDTSRTVITAKFYASEEANVIVDNFVRHGDYFQVSGQKPEEITIRTDRIVRLKRFQPER